MSGLFAVMAKEWKCFRGSDRGTFILYMALVLVWSMLLALRANDNFSAGPLWLVFLSIVITANFSNAVFISERFNGSLEIFITSGLSRDAILFGKILFISLVSLVFGGLCIGISFVTEKIIFIDRTDGLSFSAFLLYAASTLFSVCCSAYLSVKMTNHRLLHFINMFMVACIVTVYMLASAIYGLSEMYLSLFMTVSAVLFSVMARRLYHSEKIVQPVNM